MSKIRNQNWKLECRNKLAEELHQSEKVLRGYFEDDSFRYYIVAYTRRICAAIGRYELGIYGQCIKCRWQISHKRLLAHPLEELCVNCRTKQKRHNRSKPYAAYISRGAL
jgi:RNA polymerase-binding transcription factor DksA